ncbi:MAG: ABC transporter transmembrane domain-containing protein [Pseudomonadota bacterium]
MRLDGTLIASTVLINLLALAMPLAVLQVYDRIAPQNAQSTLLMLCLGLGLVAVFEFALRVLQGGILSLNAIRFGQSVEANALHRLLRSPMDVNDASPPELTRRFQSVDQLIDFFSGQGRLALLELPFAIVFFLVIAAIGGTLVLVPLGVFLIFFVVIVRVGASMKEAAAKRGIAEAKTTDFTTETLSAVLCVKAHAMENLLLRRYERLVKTLAALQKRHIALSGDSQQLSVLFGNLNVIATVSAGAVYVSAGSLSVGGLAACSLLSARAIQPLLRAARAWSETERASIAAEDVASLFSTPAVPAPLAYAPIASAPKVSAENLKITRNDMVVIENATFEIRPNTVAALVGSNNSGRSSVLLVAAGITSVSDGALLVDDVPAQTFRAQHARSVSFVSQRARLFTGTILENLTLFGQGPSVEDALWAAELLGLDTLVQRLPRGYSTPVALGASDGLPAGLLRMIAIARAVAGRPKLLMLEEPVAFMDEGTQQLFLEALPSLRSEMTVLLSTFRPEVAVRADQILLCRDGLVEERPISEAENVLRLSRSQEDQFADETPDDENAVANEAVAVKLIHGGRR